MTSRAERRRVHHSELTGPLRKIPINLQTAKDFVWNNHAHLPGMTYWKFGVGLEYEDKLVAVGTAGRPNARMLDDNQTLELTRVCTLGTPNACSMIYSALINAGKALGYTRFVTYVLHTETGDSLKAIKSLGIMPDKHVPGRVWTGQSAGTGLWREPIEANIVGTDKTRYMLTLPTYRPRK